MAEEQRHPQGYLSPDIRKTDLANTLPQSTDMMSHNVGNPVTLRYIPEEQMSPPHTGESLKSHFLALFAVPTIIFKF